MVSVVKSRDRKSLASGYLGAIPSEPTKCKNCNSKAAWSNGQKQGLFCSNICFSEYKKSETRKKHLQDFKNGSKVYRSRLYHILVNQDGNVCQICNIPGEWNGKPLRLRVDHIDGNASNHNPNNYRLICPNCDSQTDTYCSKNNGKGRGSRGLRAYD